MLKPHFLLALVAIAWTAPTPLARADDPPAKTEMVRRLEGLKGRAFEASFLKQMIHHHASGIEMAKLIPERTDRKELRDLGEKIVSSQEKESRQMADWLESWHGESKDREFKDERTEEKTKREMAELERSKGPEFDRLFLAAMTEHHRQAVVMAELVPARTDREEMEKAARKIVDAQSKQVEQMKRWQSEWFNSGKE